MSGGIDNIDLHGKNAYQAKIAIDAALRRAPAGVYAIRLTHGYNLGTILKEMIRRDYSFHPRVLRVECEDNPGQTVLVLRELIRVKK